MSRTVSEATKKRIAGSQRYKCNNKPGSNLKGLENYKCLLWTLPEDPGIFDEGGYEIDHIYEFSLTHDDSENNLQALCHTCHAVKTKRFLNQKLLRNKKLSKRNKIKSSNKPKIKSSTENNINTIDNSNKNAFAFKNNIWSDGVTNYLMSGDGTCNVLITHDFITTFIKPELISKIHSKVIKECYAGELLLDSNKYGNVDDYNYKLIMNRIENTEDIDILRIIISTLLKSAYFGECVTNDIIDKKINLFYEMGVFCYRYLN
jgi:hypothetical protein